MKSIYLTLIQFGLDFLRKFLDSLLANHAAPDELIDAIKAAIDALESHKNDVMSAADWENLRG